MATAAAVSLLLAACGEVHFVPNPYLARNVEVTFSTQENLTLFAWELGQNVDPERVTFELAAGDGWRPLVFEDAPFPAGAWPCGVATCFRYTEPGRYEPPASGLVLRSRHPDHGQLPPMVARVATVPTTLSMAPRFRYGNSELALRVDDLLAPPETPLRRSYRFQIRKSPAGGPLGDDTFDGETAGNEVVPVPDAPASEPRYDVLIEPVAAPGYVAVGVRAERVPVQPDLLPLTHRYDAPIEDAPVISQVIFDLEIPNEERCAATIAEVEATIDRYFGARDPDAFRFPSVNLATDGVRSCRQQLGAVADLGAMAQRIRSHVAANVPGTRGTRVVAIYLNNLAAPPSPQRQASLDRAYRSLAWDPRVGLFPWFIVGFPAGTSDATVRFDAFVSPRTAAFTELIETFAKTNLPFRSLVHAPGTPLEFLPHEAWPLPNVVNQVKKCAATPEVSLSLGLGPDARPTLPFGDGLPPVGYLVDLPAQDRVPISTFVPGIVHLDYEVCRRFCDHPFDTIRDEWIPQPWSDVVPCRGTP